MRGDVTAGRHGWRRGALLGGAALLLSAASTAAGQDAARVVTGTVRDSAGGEILGAEVEVDVTLQRGVTDERGVFRLAGVPAAASSIRVRRLGYRPDTIAIAAGARDTAIVDVRLVPVARRLTAVVVAAGRTRYRGRLAGYYQRLERRASGQFITRDEIERENPRLLTHLLQRVPGLQSARGRGAIPTAIRMRGRNCAPLVWVDGTPAVAGDVDLDSFTPESLEGIELYLGATGAPGTFQWTREASNCGTILLWSREARPKPPRPDDETRTGELAQLVEKAALFTAATVDQPARLRDGAQPVVAYPPSLRAAGAPGRVVAEFVVDSGGRVVAPTLGLVSATHALFGEAVIAALPAALFEPAVRNGRRVPQLVQQGFVFEPDATALRRR